MERLKALFDSAELIPFFLSTGSPKLNFTRVIETLIIAGITGGIVLYGTVKILETKMDSIEKSQLRTEAWYYNLDAKIDDVKDRTYTHEHKTK